MNQTESLSVIIHETEIPVLFEHAHITREQALKSISCVPFTDWLTQVTQDKRFVVKKIHIQGVDFFGPRVGFIKFKADIFDDTGKFLPGVVFMRGGAVGILVILSC